MFWGRFLDCGGEETGGYGLACGGMGIGMRMVLACLLIHGRCGIVWRWAEPERTEP
jgi:hypothetical protein